MPNVKFENTPLPDIIELRGVSHTYDGGKSYVIKDLSLLIEDKPDSGQFMVVLGPSGCGKSTILRYLAGLQKPTSGEVFLHGRPRTEEDRVGMVFQKYSSFPWMTVLDNVALGLRLAGMGKEERDTKAMEIIKMVGLGGHERKFAQYPVLSGGQLQRVAIARSLVVNPDIILMDEPFGALDINTRLRMQDLLVGIWDRFHSTVLFVTHDISEAVYLADEIVIMSAAPAIIKERIIIDLPADRTRLIKRDKRFVNLVYDIEDKMVALEKEAQAKRAQ